MVRIQKISQQNSRPYTKSQKATFTDSVSNLNDSKTIWKHLRTATKTSNPSSNTLPDELIINNQKFSNSEDIAFKLNNYFAKISELFQDKDEIPTRPDFTKLNEFINDRIPNDIRFEIPFISIAQVSILINGLNIAKATGLDSIGPRILKMANDILAPSIAALINKSIKTAKFPDKLKKLKMVKIYPIHKGATKCDPANYRPISIFPTVSKIFEKHINKHLMAFLNKYKLIHANQSGFRQNIVVKRPLSN